MVFGSETQSMEWGALFSWSDSCALPFGFDHSPCTQEARDTERRVGLMCYI
jgi:hypothetical protein